MSMRVGVRNISNACVSRKMRESWKVWSGVSSLCMNLEVTCRIDTPNVV